MILWSHLKQMEFDSTQIFIWKCIGDVCGFTMYFSEFETTKILHFVLLFLNPSNFILRNKNHNFLISINTSLFYLKLFLNLIHLYLLIDFIFLAWILGITKILNIFAFDWWLQKINYIKKYLFNFFQKFYWIKNFNFEKNFLIRLNHVLF